MTDATWEATLHQQLQQLEKDLLTHRVIPLVVLGIPVQGDTHPGYLFTLGPAPAATLRALLQSVLAHLQEQEHVPS